MSGIAAKRPLWECSHCEVGPSGMVEHQPDCPDKPTLLGALTKVRELAVDWSNSNVITADDPDRIAAFVNTVHNLAVDAIRVHRAENQPVS